MDITHDVDKFAVRDGALHLWSAVPYLPIGAHVAVVDPGVGTARNGIALQTLRGDYLVGPDNGLLMPAAARLGGITKAHLLEDPRYRLAPVSTSFHGRDVFAPAAAHLATGHAHRGAGRPLDPRQLQELDWPRPVVRPGVLDSHVLYVDGFGNVKLSALGGDLNAALPGLRPGEPLLVRVGDGARGDGRTAATWAATFGAVRARGPAALSRLVRARVPRGQPGLGRGDARAHERTTRSRSPARPRPSCHRRARRHEAYGRRSAPTLISAADPRDRGDQSPRVGDGEATRIRSPPVVLGAVERAVGRLEHGSRRRTRHREAGDADRAAGAARLAVAPARVASADVRRTRCATPIAPRAVVDGRRSANSSPP